MNVKKPKRNFTNVEVQEIIKNCKSDSEKRLRDGLELLLEALEESADDLDLTEKMTWEYFRLLKSYCKLLEKTEVLKNA